MMSLKGQLLIASPDLVDGNFVKSVVLLLQHSEEGAFGLVLNRPTQTTVGAAWEQVSELPCHIEAPIYLGGPCQGPLMVLHTESSLSSSTALQGVFFTGESENVESLILRDEEPIRFFVGYSGWGAGQLEDEMASGSWKAAPAEIDHIFGDETDLWQQLTRQAYGEALRALPGVRHVPDDPSLN